MEVLLTPVVNKLLRRYIKSAEGRSGSSLRVSLSGGSVVLHNLELNLDPLLGGLPVKVERAFARQLRLVIPWTALATQPIQVFIPPWLCHVQVHSLIQQACRSCWILLRSCCVLATRTHKSLQPPNQVRFDIALGDVQSSNTPELGLSPLAGVSEAAPGGGWMGSLTTLFMQALFNTSVSIKNIIVRYVAPHTTSAVTCGALSFYTATDGWRLGLKARPGCVAALLLVWGVSCCLC